MADIPKTTVLKNVPVANPLSFDDEEKLIRDVNTKYNQIITYKNQPRTDGQPGSGGWQLNDLPDGGEGDCDTYARTKGEALARAGFNTDKLSIVAAKLWNGVDHAVLRVDRGEGKYVYLTNPMNQMQRNYPEATILTDLPGKPAGGELAYPIWGLFKDIVNKPKNGKS